MRREYVPMSKIRTVSLVWKMTLLMTLLLFIPIAVIGISYFQMFQKTIFEKSEGDLQSSLTKLEGNINETLESLETFFDELFYRVEFSYYLDPDVHMSQKEKDYYISAFQQEQINARYVYSQKFIRIGVYSRNMQIDENQYLWQYYYKDLKRKPYFSEIMDNKEEIIFGQVRNIDLISTNLDISNLSMGDTGTKILPVYRKVYNLSSKEIIGVVEVDVDFIRLTNKNTLETEAADCILLDQQGKVLIDTADFDENLEQQIADSIQGDAGNKEIKLNNEQYMLMFRKHAKTGLLCVSILSKEKLTRYLNIKMMQIIFVMVLCVLAMATITYVIIKNMLKRLLKLDVMIKKMQTGDFKVYIPNNKEGDEITRITNSFNNMAEKLEMVLAEAIKKEKMQQETELRALQAQINPHFLYNTLENMRMQCEIDEYYVIGNSLAILGDLFRYSIKWNVNQVPFHLEWNNLKNYLDIMRMRFEENLECTLKCDNDVEDVIVPKLILQPLVENSFNHGFKGMLPPWKLFVCVKKLKNKINIVIQDNGVGIPKDRMDQLLFSLDENNYGKRKDSIGVVNVKHRIELICKEGSTFEITSEENKGTRIEINIII